MTQFSSHLLHICLSNPNFFMSFWLVAKGVGQHVYNLTSQNVWKYICRGTSEWNGLWCSYLIPRQNSMGLALMKSNKLQKLALTPCKNYSSSFTSIEIIHKTLKW